MSKVAIQGQSGSYHDIARQQFFANSSAVPCTNFEDVFKCVDKNEADFGLIAIENSLYGSINRVYDLLLEYKPWVCGEVYLRIEHCLVAMSAQPLEEITEIHSQHEALEQCREFFRAETPQADLVEADDTAGSVAALTTLPATAAAVGSSVAAELHQGVILKKGIETNKQNYTRFIVFQKEKHYDLANVNKTSIVLELPERPGSLHHVLSLFANVNINLSKIESRPIIGKAWHYMFYLDFDAGVDEPSSRETIKQLDKIVTRLEILGSYKSFKKS